MEPNRREENLLKNTLAVGNRATSGFQLCIEEIMKFVLATLRFVPEVDREDVWEETKAKILRGFPWLLTENHKLCFLGVGRGWRGLSERGRVNSRAVLPATILGLDALVTWIAHFVAACVRLAKRDSAVVVASEPLPGLGAAVAKALFPGRIPLIVRVQSFSTSRALYLRKSHWQFWLLNRIERFVVTRADLVVTGNDATTKLALSHGVKAERILVMPWPVSWVKNAEVVDLPCQPTVLHAGRLEKEKGVYELLDAMKWVTEKLPGATLLVAGGGGERQGMEAMTKTLGLDKQVSFLGWLKPPELMAAYKRSTVLVLPSIYDEALGMVLVEAGLMGRPVVCSGTGGMGEVVKHGKNGLIVPRGDVQALGEAILSVLSDPVSAKRMGLAGKKFADNFLRGREQAVERVRDAIFKLVFK